MAEIFPFQAYRYNLQRVKLVDVRENLANYKVPRDITMLDELPRSITGKVERRELQDRAARA